MRFKWPPVLAVSRVKSHELPRVVDKVSGALGRSWKSEELGARRGWRLLQQGSVETSAWKLFNEFLLHENAFARETHAETPLPFSRAGNAVKNRRLPQSDPSYRPARHASYFFACFGSRGPPPLAEFPLSGRREWREEGFFRERIDELYGGGGEFGFDSFGRRRLWKARSFNRILKGSLIWVSRV